MSKEIEQFTRQIEAVSPAHGEDVTDTLYELLDPIEQLPGAEAAIPAIFSFMERNPGANIGSPGPLVHFVERFYPAYVEQLISSIERRPTLHTIWMLNRILNSNLLAEQRERFLRVLRLVADHPAADSSTKEAAEDFWSYQGGH